MALNSIRFKLTLWFALTLAILMLVSEIFWDRHLSVIMEENTDSRLSQATETLVTHHLQEHARPGGVTDDCALINDFVNRYNWGVYVQQLNSSGEIICTTGNFGEMRFPLGREARWSLSKGKAHYETYEEISTGRFRIITSPVYHHGQLTDILQVGKDLAVNDSNLANLLQVRIVYTPLLIILLSGCGWFLAGRALAPIRRITDDIRNITADDLNRRLPIDKTPNELTELSRSFNETLERLSNSFNRIKQFTGDASHELRTPLAILKGETEVSLRWAKGEDELRRTLASNLEEIERMERITQDLLNLAKSESGEFRLNLSIFSLNDLLQDLYIHGNTLGEPKQIETALHLEVDYEVYIRADQMHLHRALLNLLTNAIKYTSKGGHVDLFLALDVEGQARIRVRDNGIGIPPEHLPHIFERFYRVDEARNRDVGGTGLGLAIVQAIVTAHEGRIDVTSTPGQGSEFTIHLPLDGPAQKPAATRDSTTKSS